MRTMLAACLLLIGSVLGTGKSSAGTASLQLLDDQDKQELRASAGDRQLFVYNYADSWDLPHFYPLNTPSGKNLLVQKTEPYPHHRSFWVSDTVVRDGVKGDIYNAYYSGRKLGKQQHTAPFDTRARHESFSDIVSSGPQSVSYSEKLVWETSTTKTAFPLLNEYRSVRLHMLQNGNYLLDFRFELGADYGDVKFVSDAVHYAWPYLRINSQFNVETGGGTLISDSGTTGQKETNLQSHAWIDYSNHVNGETEGIAVFQSAGDNRPKWLTRDYGTFGPRRSDGQSGKPFTLPQGEKLKQRVAVYVHRGDSDTGNVADVYNRYVSGEFDR